MDSSARVDVIEVFEDDTEREPSPCVTQEHALTQLILDDVNASLGHKYWLLGV